MSERAFELLGDAIEESRDGSLEARYFWISTAYDRLDEERARYEADLAIAEADAGDEEPA